MNGAPFVLLTWVEFFARTARHRRIQFVTMAVKRDDGGVQEQLRIGFRSNVISVVAVVLSFLSVCWTITQSETAMKLDERAWVGASDVAPVTPKQGELMSDVRVLYRNVGKTPALDVRSHIDWRLVESEIPAVDQDPSDYGRHSGILILPSGEAHATHAIPQNVAELLNSGKGGGFVFGTVWYLDIFGNQHWSQFCFQVGPRLQNFWGCNSHNQYDGQRTSTSSLWQNQRLGSSLMWLDVHSGAIQAVCAVLGLIGLSIYTALTYGIRRASLRQVLVSQRPVLVLDNLNDEGRWRLHNKGAGPALRVHWKIGEKNQRGGWHDLGAIAVNDWSDLASPQNGAISSMPKGGIRVHYEDLGGNSFCTTAAQQPDSVNQDHFEIGEPERLHI